MTLTVKRSDGSTLTLGRELGAGGEGKIYAVVGEPRLVAKIYHPDQLTPERIEKLAVMLDNPPEDPTRANGHISIAWPTDRILNMQGRYVGFLMPYIDTSRTYPLLKVYNPQTRRQTIPGFTWLYLLRTARNLASTLDALHKKNYIVGDLNERNILVTDTALVTFVDCDSLQVKGNAQIFYCSVGSLEYTPPELQGKDFAHTERVRCHDNFGLTVLIFLLLMEGRHPFTGVWQGDSIPPTLEENIRSGLCPYFGSSLLLPPKNALALSILPSRLRKLIRRSFVHGQRCPRLRPSARAWFRALREMEYELTLCHNNTQHVYSQHLQQCPWCERIARGFPDPFLRARATTRLPTLPPRQFSYALAFTVAGIEAALWYLNARTIDPWFLKAPPLLQNFILLIACLLPLVIPLIVRSLPRRTRASRRR